MTDLPAVRLPIPSLVILVGPSGSGKSTWAAANFRPTQVIASDDLRAVVGEGPDDQRAGTDAFDVLDLVLERRLRRRLTTVVDTLGLDPARRAAYLALAARHGVACHAVVFTTPAAVCRARNKTRSRPVPAKVLTSQLAATPALAAVAEEGFAGVHPPGPVRLVPPALLAAPAFAGRQKEDPVPLRFGLQIPSFHHAGGPAAIAGHLGDMAAAAEAAGFTSLWVIDHFLQIPQVGPEWQDMLDSYTTLGFLAARTRTVRLGALVTGITYRNLAHLAKIVATLDVLSAGRAVCGLGAAWFEREHRLYGWEFPAPAVRYQLLEDALELLPLMWGPGSPPFSGRTTQVEEAICYPRPLQAHLPILIGGSGEKRTLALVARYADACNLFGDPATVRHKLAVLHAHCRAELRDPSEITVTHLSTVMVGSSGDEVAARLEALRPPSVSPEAYAVRVNAGTVEDHVGRFREFADAGVHTAIVNMPALDPEAVARFGPVIAAFPGGARDW
ncbi:MAG TPA: TIGR03560 family F420-dependent LLM class oxidoreductase [Acidimicrobiales bacterium]|nr:TIGR03560 family F420-dependent LLM class oxidoreductase [Acidimicrobiales bacterium]